MHPGCPSVLLSLCRQNAYKPRFSKKKLSSLELWTPKIQDSRDPPYGAILKIVKSSYFNQKSSDFDEIWYINADLELGDSHVIKYENFKIQDGGRPPF